MGWEWRGAGVWVEGGKRRVSAHGRVDGPEQHVLWHRPPVKVPAGRPAPGQRLMHHRLLRAQQR